MDNSGASSGGGICFAGLLGIVFIVLKLCGEITWSWIWVLSPLWLPAVVFFCLALGFLIVAKICS